MDDDYQLIHNLERMNPIREAVLREAIESLHLPPGSQGLDIGCGIGDQAILLAKAVATGGSVTGLDISAPVLFHARHKISLAQAGEGIIFVQGDMTKLPFARDSFDWAWSMDCVGYPVSDLLPILQGICRTVRTGGMVALLAWTSQQLLPGYAMLEARLNATCSPYASYLEGRKPEEHFMQALHWFSPAGLTHAVCKTFIGQVQAPLSLEEREGMTLLFEMLWGNGEGLESQDEIKEFRRLCSPASPDFLPDSPDYYGFFTYTMFSGRVTKGG